MADPGCGMWGLSLNSCPALVGVAVSQALRCVWPEGLGPARLAPGSGAAVPGMLGTKCLSRCVSLSFAYRCVGNPVSPGLRGKGTGCGRRGEVARCVPPNLHLLLGRLGIHQPGWPSLQPEVQDVPPSAAPSCPVCLSILPFLPLLFFLLFPSSSSRSPVCPCCCLMLKIWGNTSKRCLDLAHQLSDCSGWPVLSHPQQNPT